MFVRACRSATIRTRLDGDAVRERLAALAGRPSPEGLQAFLAKGSFSNWTVGAHDFHLDYRVNNPKNPQEYAVQGKLQETPDWRIVRLKLTAHDPWLGPIELGAAVLFLGFSWFAGDVPPMGAILIFTFVMAVYAFANLFYIPDAVTTRLASLIASEIRGSVLIGGEWVVPTD